MTPGNRAGFIVGRVLILAVCGRGILLLPAFIIHMLA